MKDHEFAGLQEHHRLTAKALLFEINMHYWRVHEIARAFGRSAEDSIDVCSPLNAPDALVDPEVTPSPGPPAPDGEPLPPGVPPLVQRRIAAVRRASRTKLQDGSAPCEAGEQDPFWCSPPNVVTQSSGSEDSDGESSVESAARIASGELRKSACEANPPAPVVTLPVPAGRRSTVASANSAYGSLNSGASSRRNACPRLESASSKAASSFGSTSDSDTSTSREGRQPNSSMSLESEQSAHFNKSRLSKNSMQNAAIFRRLSAVGIESAGDKLGEDCDTPTLRSRARNFVTSVTFDTLMAMFVITNAVTIGIQVDHAGMHFEEGGDSEDAPQRFEYIETVFCVIFACELAIRLYALRAEFFAKPGWNYFDALLVTLQVIEELAKAVGRTTGSSSIARNVKVMKAWRLLRLFRSMRLIRIVRFVDELSKLVYLVVCSFWSFLWTIMLLLILTYITGTFITQIVADHGHRTPESIEIQLRIHFGRLGSTVFALFESIFGGIDWKELADPLFHISVLMPPFLALYVAFTVLVLLNLVTGVFVETAQRKKDHDTQDELQQKLKRALKKADLRLDALISVPDFRELLAQEEMVAYLKGHNMDEASMMSVFKLLFERHQGCITPQEFLTFCLRLEGTGATIELGKLHLQTSKDLQEIQMSRSRDRTKDKKAIQKLFHRGVKERNHLKLLCEELRDMQVHCTHDRQEFKDFILSGTKERKALRVLHERSREVIKGYFAELRVLQDEAVKERADLSTRVSQLMGSLVGGKSSPIVAPAAIGGFVRSPSLIQLPPLGIQPSLRDLDEVGTEAPG